MLPGDLNAASFSVYPPEARALAERELHLLRKLPLSFVPLLLRELIDYDWRFPAERTDLDRQFTYLNSRSDADVTALMQPFSALHIGPDLTQMNWVNDPVLFSEKLSAQLWATQQMEAFRKASIDYVHGLTLASPDLKPQAPRVSVILVGQGVDTTKYPLFRKLRPHGVYHTNVAPQAGYASVLEYVASRAKQYPAPFGHWFIDGHESGDAPQGVSLVSYSALQSARATLIDKMIQTMKPGGGGPELLRTELAHMQPAEAGLPDSGRDAILSRFKLALLTQGSGTQMFSTTFVQWTAREVLRRAQPITLFARYWPRQKEPAVKPPAQASSTDAAASLIDADQGAYYTWINQQRLSGASDARFLVWFEGHGEALICAPSLPRGEADNKPIAVGELLARLG